MSNDFFRGKRCLVTGHRGFIGTHLSAELTRLGADVYGFDLATNEKRDVTCMKAVNGVFAHVRPHLVFHLAAQTEVGVAASAPWATYHANVYGTLNVVNAAMLYRVRGIVVASSDKAYGDHACGSYASVHGVVDERHELRNNADAYSASKRMADDLAHDYFRLTDLPVRVIRCVNTYGPGQTNETTLITSTAMRLLRGEEPVIYKEARHTVREWLYIDDAVQAYLHLARDAHRQWEAGGPNKDPQRIDHVAYNVGSGERKTVSEVVTLIADRLGREKFATYGPAGFPQIGNQGLDSTRFRERFPSWGSLSFQEGLSRTIDWYVKQELWGKKEVTR